MCTHELSPTIEARSKKGWSFGNHGCKNNTLYVYDLHGLMFATLNNKLCSKQKTQNLLSLTHFRKGFTPYIYLEKPSSCNDANLASGVYYLMWSTVACHRVGVSNKQWTIMIHAKGTRTTRNYTVHCLVTACAVIICNFRIFE